MIDMLEVSTFNVDKFAHKFIQNLGLRIEPCVCKKVGRIKFLAHTDRSHRIKQLLLYSAEKMKEINVQENLTFSNEGGMKYIIDKCSITFDNLTYLNNTRTFTSYLKSINAKILQNITIRKKGSENIKKSQVKGHKSNQNVGNNMKMRSNLTSKVIKQKKESSIPLMCRERNINYSHKKDRGKVFRVSGSSKLFGHNVNASKSQTSNKISLEENGKDNILHRHNPNSHMINIAKKELEMTRKYIQLCINEMEHLKRNIQVTLHIKKKPKGICNGMEQYDQILCHHAILCLIEPSKQALVLLEDEIIVVAQKYLSQGYSYHFEFQRHLGDYYTALLILNPLAKILVRDINATVLRTICIILQCDVNKILVLHNCAEENFYSP